LIYLITVYMSRQLAVIYSWNKNDTKRWHQKMTPKDDIKIKVTSISSRWITKFGKILVFKEYNFIAFQATVLIVHLYLQKQRITHYLLCPRNSFIFISQKFYILVIITSYIFKKILIGHLPKPPFASVAFWQLVH
jgi:hypothetical protein